MLKKRNFPVKITETTDPSSGKITPRRSIDGKSKPQLNINPSRQMQHFNNKHDVEGVRSNQTTNGKTTPRNPMTIRKLERPIEQEMKKGSDTKPDSYSKP